MPETDVSQPLPSDEHPPVVETILGVQFDRLARFRNAHLGAFWKTLDQEEWPTVADAPLLPPQFERFTQEVRWAQGLPFHISHDPSVRLQIKNRGGDRMIQLQNNRFHFNGLKDPGGAYPRYETVREGFAGTLETFLAFVNQEQLGPFCANQWEVTYLNHIPKGTVWHSPHDWGFFLPLRPVANIDDLLVVEGFSGEWSYEIPDQRGRLYVRWQYGHKADESQQELIVLTLTARGPLHDVKDDMDRILEGVDLGRRAIVQSFATLMSDDANSYWGLQHDNR